MAIALSYPSQLATEITLLGTSDWLVGETSAGVVGKLKRQALSNITAEWSASKIYLPSGGDIGYWNGSAYVSRMEFLSTSTIRLYGSDLEIKDAAGTAWAPMTCRELYLPSGHYIGEYVGLFAVYTDSLPRVGIGSTGNFIPAANNTYTCGNSSNKWSAVWATNGTIQTSDADDKTDIADSDLGLDFILALRPVKYRFIVGGNTVTAAKEPGEPPIQTSRPGVRTHYGLLAQQVKEAVGPADFGGHVVDAETGQHGLRYSQFIAPIIKALQEEHAARLAAEARIDALELRLAKLEALVPHKGVV